MICEVLKNKYNYWEQPMFEKYSKLYKETYNIWYFFIGRAFWIENNTLFFSTKDRGGLGPRAEYVKGQNYVTEVILVRKK